MWLWISITIVVSVIAGGIIICVVKHTKNVQRQLIILQEKNKQIEEINKQIKDANKKIENETTLLREQLSVNLINDEQDIQNKIAAARAQLDELIKSIGCRTAEMNSLSERYGEENRKLINVLRDQDDVRQQVNKLTVELEELVKKLDDAKLINRQFLMSQEELKKGWFEFQLNDREQRLISTIAEISGLYPELKKELAAIEWKKVRLPQIQKWSSAISVKGIYRLVLKKDENICYVGQAVNIKDRWYEHIKKMIGADNKGSEKLYDYRPNEFYWTIIESGCNDLNTAEKYWIEYYCCREKGLNKRI